MQKLNILLWVSLLMVFVSCKHELSEPSDTTFTITVSAPRCYEGDTLSLQVFVNDNLFAGNVNWNLSDITSSGTSHSVIAPVIHSDSILLEITAQYENQSATKKIWALKRAFKEPPVSYQTNIQPLLIGNCNFSGCHANGSRAGKVELSVYDSVIKHVAPFNAPSSLLYYALIKTDPLRVMPPAGKLHDYKIESVRLWIEQGAKNN